MRCDRCGSENRAGGKFCRECGSPLSRACPSCGTPVPSDAKFCDECGTTLTATGSVVAAAAEVAPREETEPRGEAFTPELRHVSVLFCDLVGFTPLSESRDPEEVRELLSGYFDLARSIVGRYGGVIQKFIGDAVMAVWGVPVANEDDAERAVRAGLELVSAVSDYGSERGIDLDARVGIVTGGAATTETADEGLVIGDRVNTAARIQSVAPPGCCYVDETTRAATAAAIAYADAGSHELKGKSEPLRLHQANRVIAAIAGSQRSGVLEAPFSGRDHELRLVKELFHVCAERSAARLVLVSGVAGVGKSRLAWEFFKYIDGLVGDVLWHGGRCLSYGEGVSYWALAEMVRARLQIGEDDPSELIAERLRNGLERWIPAQADRDFIAPRLGQLLGLPARQALGKEELFSGWRLFFERLSEHLPVVMVVEDLQWADAGMIEFLDHLLEWSGDHPLYLLVLTRPVETDQRGLTLSRRNLTTLSLDPLPDGVIGELLDGLVADLPDSLRARIVERAEGIPLYAVETIRSLLDKGLLEKRSDGVLHLVAEVGTLEIPPGLTALIASRLDALSPPERRVVKECSVLGASFPRSSIEAVTEMEAEALETILSALVRREVLTVRADKLSPERGQYAFTQSLIRSVAYEMLSRAERKARHRATAEHLRAAFPEHGADVAEVIAAHLYDAYRAAGGDADADELRLEAKEAFAVAGDRAASVGAPLSAEAAFLRAAELSSDDAEQAGYTARAGRMASFAGFAERALGYFETAIASHAAAGRVVEIGRVTAWRDIPLATTGRAEQSIADIRKALAALDPVTAPPEVLADLQAALGSGLLFSGKPDEAQEPIERALTLGQHYELAEPLGYALVTQGTLLSHRSRTIEARAAYEAGLEVGQRNGITRIEAIAGVNLADLCMIHDLDGAEEHCLAAIALARRWGARHHELVASGNLMYVLEMAGRWDEALQLAAEGDAARVSGTGSTAFSLAVANLHAAKGDVLQAREHLRAAVSLSESDDVQDRGMYEAARSAVASAEGDWPTTVQAAGRAISIALDGRLAICHEAVRRALPILLDAEVAIGDVESARPIVERLAQRSPGEIPPFLRAQLSRAEVLSSAGRIDDEAAARALHSVVERLQELAYPYFAAMSKLDLADVLERAGRREDARATVVEACQVFERLGAAPALHRARMRLQLGDGPESTLVAGGHVRT